MPENLEHFVEAEILKKKIYFRYSQQVSMNGKSLKIKSKLFLH